MRIKVNIISVMVLLAAVSIFTFGCTKEVKIENIYGKWRDVITKRIHKVVLIIQKDMMFKIRLGGRVVDKGKFKLEKNVIFLYGTRKVNSYNIKSLYEDSMKWQLRSSNLIIRFKRISE